MKEWLLHKVIQASGNLICNQRVGGLSPSGGTTLNLEFPYLQEIFQKSIHSSLLLKFANYCSYLAHFGQQNSPSSISAPTWIVWWGYLTSTS